MTTECEHSPRPGRSSGRPASVRRSPAGDLRPPPRGLRGSSAFTLVEALVAMAIAVLLTLLLGRLFLNGQQAMRLGERTSALDGSARAVLDFMQTELSQAAVDPDGAPVVLTLKATQASPDVPSLPPTSPHSLFGMLPPDEIYFVSFANEPTGGVRTARQVHYYVTNETDAAGTVLSNRFCLMRSAVTAAADLSCYDDPQWYLDHPDQDAEPLVREVRAFYVQPWTNAYAQAVSERNYQDSRQGAPVLLELYLELLDEPDAIRSAERWAADPTDAADFIAGRSRRYERRVSLRNLQGYTLPGVAAP